MLKLNLPLPYDPADPLEQGGMLFGRPGDVHMCTGSFSGDERSTHHLLMLDPRHGLAAYAAAEKGWQYLGYWHSHPAGTPCEPSEIDIADWYRAAEQMFTAPAELLPWLDFIIHTGGVTRAWRLSRDLNLKEVKTWT